MAGTGAGGEEGMEWVGTEGGGGAGRLGKSLEGSVDLIMKGENLDSGSIGGVREHAKEVGEGMFDGPRKGAAGGSLAASSGDPLDGFVQTDGDEDLGDLSTGGDALGMHEGEEGIGPPDVARALEREHEGSVGGESGGESSVEHLLVEVDKEGAVIHADADGEGVLVGGTVGGELQGDGVFADADEGIGSPFLHLGEALSAGDILEDGGEAGVEGGDGRALVRAAN
jgi:hypothetical protein